MILFLLPCHLFTSSRYLLLPILTAPPFHNVYYLLTFSSINFAMIYPSSILGLSLFAAASAVHGSVIPHKYLGRRDTSSYLQQDRSAGYSDPTETSTFESYYSPSLAEDIVIPNSIEKYVSQWQELYNNFRFHSAMHQPASPPAPVSSGSQNRYNSQAGYYPVKDYMPFTGDNEGDGDYDGINDERTMDFTEHNADIVTDNESSHYEYQPIPGTPPSNDLVDGSTPDESLIPRMDLGHNTGNETPKFEEVDSLPVHESIQIDDFTNGSQQDPDNTLRDDVSSGQSPESAGSEREQTYRSTLRYRVFKRDLIPVLLRRVKRSSNDGNEIAGDDDTSFESSNPHSHHKSFEDFGNDTIEYYYNDALSVDEYEFGYDDRDAVLENPISVLQSTKNNGKLNCIKGKGKSDKKVLSRIGRCAKLDKGVYIRYSKGTLNGTGFNATRGRLDTQADVYTMNIAAHSISGAMFGFTVAFAFATAML